MYKFISSSKLALVLVLLLILFATAGAILPQEGLMAPVDIAHWQADHPVISTLIKPIGLFRVFTSIPFMVVLFLLALNTFTCTLRFVMAEGGIAFLKGPAPLKNSGFLILHLSLIAILAGGTWSTAARMDGFVVLTEGQTFKETHTGYPRIREGPLRKDKHRGFFLRLDKVEVTHQNKFYTVDIASHLRIWENPDEVTSDVVRVNRPLSYDGLDFTIDKTGFSPRLAIVESKTRRALANSFIALKTFTSGKDRTYSDFIPLPQFKQRGQRVIVTLFPDAVRENGKIKKNSEEPLNPILLIEIRDESDKTIAHGEVPMKGRGTVGDYTFYFTALRRWCSFRVVDDPGYPIVWFSIWLGLIGILMRYLPELKGWFRNESSE